MSTELSAACCNCSLTLESCGNVERVKTFKVECNHAYSVVEVFGISVNNGIMIVRFFIIFFQAVNQLAVQYLFVRFYVVKTDLGENIDCLAKTDN